jgi:hypothetical protein
VHGFFFQRESSTFNKKLNPASPGYVKEGTNDNDPVVLEDVTPEEFEKFLWVFYNPYVHIAFSSLLRTHSKQIVFSVRYNRRRLALYPEPS